MVSLLQDMQENDQRMTMLQLIDKMKIKHKELGSELKREETEQLVIKLILDRILKEEFQHTAYATNAYVTLGPFAKQVLHGKKNVKLEISSGEKNTASLKSAKRSLSSSVLELKLDELRKEVSSIHGKIFPHSVLSTQQISMISTQKPNSLEQLEKIIGKLKTEKYGSRILEQIEKYRDCVQTDELNEGQGSQNRGTKLRKTKKDQTDELNGGQGSQNRGTKRRKTKKDLVVIESSDDEA